jgi:hypothetical protein
MFKYIKITYFMIPPSLGEGSGRVVEVCFSRSAKKATSGQGVVVRHYIGNVDGCEIMSETILERDGKVLASSWD